MVIEGSNIDSDKIKKIVEIKAKIREAEKRDDEPAVLLLEAELKALEKGENFSRDGYLNNNNQNHRSSKAKVLRAMQSIQTRPDDIWTYDARFHEIMNFSKSYENSFNSILEQIGIKDFQGFVDKRFDQTHRKLKVMDLFGGAYFLEDLNNVEKIIGVRLRNIDSDVTGEYLTSGHSVGNKKLESSLRRIISIKNNPVRQVIEGNLYKSETWKKITPAGTKRDVFDLIVCRPEGPFRNSATKETNIASVSDDGLNREEIFVLLLENALKFLSSDGGMLFSQIPDLKTPNHEWDNFWSGYVSKKQAEGYQFFFGKGRSVPNRTEFAVRRTR